MCHRTWQVPQREVLVNTPTKRAWSSVWRQRSALVDAMKRKADSYRPISLLSTISKLTEAIILKRLTAFTEDKLVPFQFGFKKLSTTDQLLRMTEIIRDNLENGRDTGAVFINIAKAFDRVWLEGLIYKMLVMSIPDGLIKLMNSYLHGRGFTVRVGNSFSSGRTIEVGVVQGSKLGPQCFSIFVKDITRNQENQDLHVCTAG
ncbi:RNA-directed DNA polymerase from mobile element jockey [Araneus ventricosus]|uniref:RNA-directed DNA polymerase from mobile element jockey n=1 Tax=Araneus ventricosus TaxID=182803 RepID=A0A4Y2HB91_ARAVE|nr:RNA-directed DNA polymerase from mobile element jockey [Araneus ventricosus]